jgi:uncharacterized protein YpuA (DUF1002 family)
VLNLYQRIALAMQSVSYVQKEKKQGMRYSIVSHDDVTSKVRPALLANGVIYYVSALAIKQAYVALRAPVGNGGRSALADTAGEDAGFITLIGGSMKGLKPARRTSTRKSA